MWSHKGFGLDFFSLSYIHVAYVKKQWLVLVFGLSMIMVWIFFSNRSKWPRATLTMNERERSGIPESFIHASMTPWISAKTVEPGRKRNERDCLTV